MEVLKTSSLEICGGTSYLLSCLRTNSAISLNHRDYKVSDWNHIKFKSTFDVPSKFELSEMISDKSMSHGVTKLKKQSTVDGSIGISHERSVIIQWLMSNYNDPIEFLHSIDRAGFGLEEIVVGVHPKERELSSQGRYFGLLTLKKRLYVVVFY